MSAADMSSLIQDGIMYAAPVPPGGVRTIENPPSSAGSVLPTGIATTVIAFICVILRLFTRTYVVRGVLGADDYLVIVSMVLSVSFLGVGTHLYSVGAGSHLYDVTYEDFSREFQQTTLGATLTYACSISFTKLSILAFYLRISPNKTFRRAVYTLIGIVTAYTITYICLMCFRCQPIAYTVDLTIEGGVCIDNLIPMMTLSIFNILLDTIVLVLPIGVVLPLQLPTRQKVSLIFLFATGGFVIAAAIQRTVIMPPLLASADAGFPMLAKRIKLTTVQYTWLLSEQFVWSYLEVNAGIICASVPALKPLFMRYLPWIVMSRLRSSQEASNNKYAGGSSLDKMSKNRKVYGQAFELRSQPDEERRVNEDDEARLWENKRGDKVEVTAVNESKLETDSLESVSEQYLGRTGTTVTSNGFGANAKGNAGGIKVTRQVQVSYQE